MTAVASTLADILPRLGGRLLGPARRGVAGHDGRPRRPGERHGDGARRRDRRRDAAGHPGRFGQPDRGGHRRRCRVHRPACTRRSMSTVVLGGGAHGLGYVVGLDDPQLYVTSGTPANRTYDVIAVGGDPAKNGPVATGSPASPAAAARSRQPGRLRRGEPAGPHPRPGPGRTGRRAVDRLRRRAARQRGLRRCPPARRVQPAAWARRLQPRLPVRDRQQLLVFAGDGLGRHRHRVARVRLAASRGSSPVRSRPASSTCSPGSSSGAGSIAGLVAAVRPRRRDVLRPVADRHERRLRRAVHRGRLHRLRRRLDRLVALAGGRSGSPCRSSA